MRDKRRISIILAVFLIVIAIVFFFFLSSNRKTDASNFVKKYFENLVENNVEEVYDALLIPENEQYLNKTIFKKKWDDRSFLGGNVKNIEYIFPEKKEEKSVDEKNNKCQVVYESNESEQVLDIEIKRDKRKKLKVKPENFLILDYEIIVPKDVEIILENQIIDNKYLTFGEENNIYLLPLFKGEYEISMRPSTSKGKVITERINPGMLKGDGTIDSSFRIEDLEMEESDMKIISEEVNKINTSIINMLSRSEETFNSAKNISQNVIEKIKEKKENSGLSYDSNYKTLSAEIKSIKINGKGEVTIQEKFQVEKTDILTKDKENINFEWTMTLVNDNNLWVVKGIKMNF
ncbi:MAG: hypothetical protein ACRCU3_08370 [Eubacteriaceae bacterium]